MPQGCEIFSDPTVAENLRAAARAHGLERTTVVDEAVAPFPTLRDLRHRPGGNLSGGQQQLARACSCSTSPPRASSRRSSR